MPPLKGFKSLVSDLNLGADTNGGTKEVEGVGAKERQEGSNSTVLVERYVCDTTTADNFGVHEEKRRGEDEETCAQARTDLQHPRDVLSEP